MDNFLYNIMLIIGALALIGIYIIYHFYTKTNNLYNTQQQIQLELIQNTQITENAKNELQVAIGQVTKSKETEESAKKIADDAKKNEQLAIQNAQNALLKKEAADKAVIEAQAQLKIADNVTQKQIAELNLVKLQQQQTEANYNATISELEKNKQIQATLNANLNICNTSQDTLKNSIKKYEADLQLLNSIIEQNKTIIDKQLNDIKIANDNYNKQKDLCAQLQKNVDDSSLNLLAKNKELTDLQNKYNILNESTQKTIDASPEYIAKVTEFKKLQIDYQNKVNELETSKKDLLTINDTLNKLKITYQDKVNEFNTLLDKYNAMNNNINTQKQTIDEQLKFINAIKTNINYRMYKNTDMADTLLANMTGTLEECQTKCNNMPECGGFVRRDSNNGCWFKGYGAKQPSVDNTTNFYYKYISPPLPVPNQSSDMIKYNVANGTDFGGQGDFYNMIGTIDECKNKCNDFTDCAGFAYEIAAKRCYLKNNTIVNPNANPAVDFYYKYITPVINNYTKTNDEYNALNTDYQNNINKYNELNTNYQNKLKELEDTKLAGCPAYNYKKGDWVNIPGGLTQVSVDKNIVCGVNAAGNIYCKDDLTSSNWKMLPGSLKHISVSNGKLYGVTGSDNIYYADDYKNPNWKLIDGGLKQVDIDGNIVCGVNAADNVYCKDDLESSNWNMLPGSLKHISVSNGKLYGVNSSDAIYYADNYKNPNWQLIPGSLKQVDFDTNVVCGVTSNNNIYCKNDLLSANWELIPGGLKYISVSKGNLYGTAGDNSIYTKS